MSAANNGHVAVIETLLEQGAAVDQAKTVGFVKCTLILLLFVHCSKLLCSLWLQCWPFSYGLIANWNLRAHPSLRFLRCGFAERLDGTDGCGARRLRRCSPRAADAGRNGPHGEPGIQSTTARLPTLKRFDAVSLVLDRVLSINTCFFVFFITWPLFVGWEDCARPSSTCAARQRC